ncbi:MAG: metal-sensing transcriptional repressor [Clostridia bacterium]|nr:metal-sensing transcriptional repressor [Clostridia bacterium]
MDEQTCPCEALPARTTERDPELVRKLVTRLNRIEGQIGGLRAMVEKGAYCPDILTQASAATAALKSFSRELLASHIKHCVKSDLLEGREETLDELMNTLQKMMN